MDSIDGKIKGLLAGEIVEDESKEFLNIDFTLVQQNYELTSRGVEPKGPAEFSPKIGVTITYVVAAVIFNERNEILMIQEAKSSCAGTWYLPAGRVNPAETFENAIKREVLQETGLEFEPSTLLLVESSQGTWYRFTYTGNVTGGQLKGVRQADCESLQAMYCDDLKKLSLRSPDCVKLIQLGKEYYNRKAEWHCPQLTVHRLVPNILLRLLIGIRSCNSRQYYVLISDSLIPHIPLAEINPSRNVHATLKKFVQHIFGEHRLPQHKPCGLLAVEHQFAVTSPTEEQFDGLCLSLLVMVKDHIEEVETAPGFSWRPLNRELEFSLLNRLSNKCKSVGFTVL